MLTIFNKDMKIGLFNGLGRKVLLNLIDSNKTGDLSKREESVFLLDIIGERMSASDDYSFSEGITGIAWMIEYCSQHQLLPINTDEVLEDVDDKIYQYTLSVLSDLKFNCSTILGLVNYFHTRLFSEKTSSHYYRRFTHLECLSLLIDRMKSFLDTVNLMEENCIGVLKEVAFVLLKFSHLVTTGMSEKDFDEVFYSKIESFVNYYESHISNMDKINDVVTILEISQLLCMTARQYYNPHWISIFESYHTKLSKDLIFAAGESSFYPTGISGVHIIYSKPVMDYKILKGLINRYDNMEAFILYLTNYKAFSLSLCR